MFSESGYAVIEDIDTENITAWPNKTIVHILSITTANFTQI